MITFGIYLIYVGQYNIEKKNQTSSKLLIFMSQRTQDTFSVYVYLSQLNLYVHVNPYSVASVYGIQPNGPDPNQTPQNASFDQGIQNVL